MAEATRDNRAVCASDASKIGGTRPPTLSCVSRPAAHAAAPHKPGVHGIPRSARLHAPGTSGYLPYIAPGMPGAPPHAAGSIGPVVTGVSLWVMAQGTLGLPAASPVARLPPMGSDGLLLIPGRPRWISQPSASQKPPSPRSSSREASLSNNIIACAVLFVKHNHAEFTTISVSPTRPMACALAKSGPPPGRTRRGGFFWRRGT